MLESRPRLPAQPPTVSPPPPFRDRRAAYRRAEDRLAHDEKVLLAHALDILAAGTSAEERLAGLLRLLARTAGAERSAVLADGVERRSAVAVDPGEDHAAAEALGAWLDAAAGRSRAERAAAGRAPISLVVGGPLPDHPALRSASAMSGTRPEHRPVGRNAAPIESAPAADASTAGTPTPAAGPAPTPAAGPAPSLVDEHGGRWYALLPIPSAGRVFLGFEFARADGARRLPERLPPQLVRHAAVALALVTEQLAAERELLALRAREAERTRFVSTVAHELRTPLTGLGGYLELILGGQVDDPAVQRDFLERSRGIVGSMGDLVGDLLELSRIESGTLTLDIAPFSVAEAASHVANGLLPIALDRGTRLTTSLPPRLQSATGDRRRVEQILTNLAGNALKFTPRGGLVEIGGRFDGGVAVLFVRDDGPGIDAADRGRIFERFHRLAGHERITGTGLGLPIARDLARRMGGDLDVASVTGSGSSFVLVLPGPASSSVDAAMIRAALGSALASEAIGLEERVVLRRLGRARATNDAVAAIPGDPDRLHGAAGTGGDNDGRSTRLRALQDSRTSDATPARRDAGLTTPA